MLNLSKISQERLEGTLEGACKGLFSMIPPFNIALAAWDGFQGERLKEFILDLSKSINRIEKEKIDSHYIETEEFYDIIQKSFKIRLQHRSKLKAKFIVSLISESIRIERNPRFNTDIKEAFLSMIEVMSDQEIAFLEDFAKGAYESKSRSDIYNEQNSTAAVALDALYTKGIFKDEDTWRKSVELSRLGKEFIDYIIILAKVN